MTYFKDLLQNIASSIFINPDDSDKEKAKKINLYYFIGSPILLVIISYIIFIVFTTANNNVKVPMVKNDNIYQAIKKLSDKKLVTSVITKYTNDAEAGIVYSQSPKQGSIVRRGRIVVLNVSLGHVRSELPDFVKSNLFDVEDFLNTKFTTGDVPFKIETPVYEFNDKFERDRIFKQEPEPGVPIYSVKNLKFWVSNGPREENTRVIKNYVGQNIEDVSKELADLEIIYSFEYDIINDRSKDMLVIAQSINEGKIVDELIEEGKILILKVNKFQAVNNDKIKGTYPLDVPEKPIPYDVEVKLQNGASKEKSIFKISTKGGATFPVVYSGAKESKLLIYYDKKLQKEIPLNTEVEITE
jgi:beta-lactam-binding protein with PASTA domain